MKKILTGLWLLILLVIIGTLFWYNELRYQLPTPLPANYTSVKRGTLIQLPDNLKHKNGKPLFLHFFNPDCPCSRFNINQFKALVNQYGKRVDFKIIAVTKYKYTAEDIRKKFDLNIPVIFDNGISTLCGVYSTPQVALLDEHGKLYYRGNYNKSRYCTDERTSYATIALNGVIKNQRRLLFDKLALTSYGCSLPGCKN
ncbi:MAG: redoxin domain-containing protein [Mucilaginibacter sp.]|nr:redoxin domain-containing protein [Mucilaginibacter sp.]